MHLAQIFTQGNPVLIAVFILLLSMSIASWYIIAWKGLRLREEYKLYNEFQQKHAHSKNWPNHLKLEKAHGYVGEIIAEVKQVEKLLPHYNHEARKEILAMHLLQKLDEIRFNLDRGLAILASIGSVAPFIGLFGTVWGIYGALTNIAEQGNAGLNVVAGPMGEALVATAVGLFAAIPAILFYNSFVRLNRLLIQNFRHIAEQITTYLSNSKDHA